jgi:DNA-binding XRE family transcriptional regulator
MLTAAQLRAARGLLDWTRADLAKAANVSPETIKNIEHGTFRPQEATTDAITRAFKAHDVEFTDDEGVRRSRDSVVKFEGVEGFKRFMDDVYEAAQQPGAVLDGSHPICVSNVDDRLFAKHLGDYSPFHSTRMNKLEKVKVRVLVKKEDNFTAPEAKYIEYRCDMQQDVSSVPFYVYGDKFAIIMFSENYEPRIVVIASPLVAKAYRDQFEVLWQNSVPRGRLK